MDYNTSRTKLKLPEYGRNIQNMVEYAVTIEDTQKRDEVAHAIIEVMGNMFPHLRDVPDFKHKLWDHLLIMSDFKLDINSPYTIPNPKTFQTKPKQIPYENERIKYKHFGRTIPKIIDEACKFEDGEKKEELILIICNHMKKIYMLWNKDTVEDETIFEFLKEYSQGKLIPPQNTQLSEQKMIKNNNKNKNSKKKYTKNN